MHPHQPLYIDESILKFKSRLTFTQYIPSKRHRFGVKFFVLCDFITGYILNFEIYTGKIDANKDEKQPISMKTVLNLLKPYLNKGHVFYVDFIQVRLCSIKYTTQRPMHVEQYRYVLIEEECHIFPKLSKAKESFVS